jgi:hypothetical protein
MREAEKIKRLRLSFATAFSILYSISPKLDESCLLRMDLLSWGLRLRRALGILALAHALTLPSPSLHRVDAPIAGFRSSIPCPLVPLFTLRLLPHDSLRKTQGQDGSLRPSCKTLSFSTSCRFIPAHVASPIPLPLYKRV